MSDVSRFFDDQHAGDVLPLPLHYRLLRRFEVTREETAASLLPPGGVVVDIGCGDGELVRRVADRHPKIIAADVAPDAVANARARTLRSNIDWVVLDASKRLPIRDATADCVVSLSTLQYIFDPAAFLREIARILKPRGHALIETPNVAYLPQRLRLLAGQPIRTSFWKHGIDGGNLHYFTVDTLRGLLEEAGFEPRRITGSGVFAPLRTWRVSLLCGNVFILAQKRS